MREKFEEKNIKVHYNGDVRAITSEGVELKDGRKIAGNVVVWATGAEA